MRGALIQFSLILGIGLGLGRFATLVFCGLRDRWFLDVTFYLRRSGCQKERKEQLARK
jgi:hypothetical protein